MSSSTSGPLKQRHNAGANNKSDKTGSSSASSSAPSKAVSKPTTTIDNQKSFFQILYVLFEGIGGTVNYSFYKAPLWVDLSKPPGVTSLVDMNRGQPKLWSILTGHGILFSPNLVWIIISALVYIYMPYDLESDQQQEGNGGKWNLQWFQLRLLLNVSIVLIYYGYWHITLYILKWGKRPFAQGRVYSLSKVIHNIWYCLLGTVQWTMWEMIMVHLYATGRIGYMKNEEIFYNDNGVHLKGIINFLGCAIFVPVFREIQFFFGHRFIHIKCFYKYIHSVHHRNTDVEPFSGLCMSPVEHLYYISSIGPSIYWYSSPFQFLWNGIHVILAPGASHSGYEDNWHSDQYHNIHHRYFECNYGTPGMPLDRWFGTFRETLAPKTKTYKGYAKESASCNTSDGDSSVTIIAANIDSKSTLLELPSWDQMLYTIITSILLPLFVIYITMHRDDYDNDWNGSNIGAHIAAFIVSVGPLILSAILTLITSSATTKSSAAVLTSWERLKYTMIYPFHKEPIMGRFGIGLFFGTLLSVVPVYHFFHSLFVQNPNDSIYNRIWGE